MSTAPEPFGRLRFESFPDDTLALALYLDVQNAAELRAQLLAGTLQPPCTLMNAEAVAGLFAVHLAAHKALASHREGSMASKSVHTELIHHLSGSTHVAEGLKRFGVSDTTRHLLLACFNATAEQEQQLDALVSGTRTSLEGLCTALDAELVKKYYKVSQQELAVGSLEDAAVCRIANKGL